MNSNFPSPFDLIWDHYHLALTRRTHIMGDLNVTPDSFSDGGLYYNRDKAVRHGIELARNGADIIDIGGESTRPYSQKISIQEELDRVIPVIEDLKKEIEIPISIDTCHSEVAGQALKCGASIINDISALRFDPELGKLAAEAGVPIILMHMQGSPENMQENPSYKDLIFEIKAFLSEAIERACSDSVKREMIILDPGIGFGKTFDHNLQIIKELSQFHSLNQPILLGSSRKAFIGKILNKEALDRDIGTMATIAAGVMNGANIVRVHNVNMAVDTVKMIDAIKRGKAEQMS